MKEFNVHRLRLGNWVPCPIKSISVDSESQLVAIGRENGEIEILDAQDNLHAQYTLSGSDNFQLQSLVWSKFDDKGRLFGVSVKGFIFEVNFLEHRLTNVSDTYGGAAWCMAASPRESVLAIGSEDGMLRLFKYHSYNNLDYHKSLTSSASRVLSVAYHPSQPRVFIGCSDGTIRCLDENTGRTFFRMTGDIHPSVYTPNIWSLAVLSDSTVISGDSRGQMQVWDGNLGVLSDSFVQHAADVLTLAVSPDESCVFASGVDGKVICLKRNKSSSHDEVKWVYTHSHRAHTHDVFSLAITKTSSQFASLGEYTVLSGGLDSKLCLYSTEQFEKIRPIWMPIITSNNLISYSSSYNRILLRHHDSIDIWNVNIAAPSSSSSANNNNNDIDLNQNCQLLLKFHIKQFESLCDAILSPQGNFFVVSTQKETKVWELDSKEAQVKLTQVSVPCLASDPLVNLAFNAKGDLLAGYSPKDKELKVFQVNANKSIALLTSIEIVDSLDFSSTREKLNAFPSKIKFSSNNKFVALSSASRGLAIFQLKANVLVSYWKLPELSSSVVDMIFAENNKTMLLLLANNQFLVVDIEKLEFVSEKSSDSNGLRSIPHELKFGLFGIASAPKKEEYLFYGALQSLFLQNDKAIPSNPKVITSFDTKKSSKTESSTVSNNDSLTNKSSKKRKHEKMVEESSENMTLIEKYRNILHMGFTDKGQLILQGDFKHLLVAENCVTFHLTASQIVIENPWTRINEQMPETLSRKRYGT